MALVPMRALLSHAQENRYAVGYFESWDLESVLSVADAAERTNSPVIIGFSGGFLSNPARKIPENIAHYGALGLSVARQARVPIAFLLNEADNLDILVRGLHSGFNAVMYQKPGEDFDTTLERTAYLARTAHYVGADVESEVGELPMSHIASGVVQGGEGTDPEKAAHFVRATGIDALAISAGNVHLLEGRKSGLDFSLIRTLREKINIPLVLHGGTGIDSAALQEAIALGVSKINVGTALKRVYIDTLRACLGTENLSRTDPHEIVGGGGGRDMLMQARHEMSARIEAFLRDFGSVGKAADFSA